MFADALKKPVNDLLARGVSKSTSAANLVRELEGRSLQIHPQSAALAVWFQVADGALTMHEGLTEAPDAALTGTPVSLAMLAGGDPEAVIRDGRVQVSGDAEIAQQFRALLQFLRPDLEEELSAFTGDVVAHEVGNAVRGATDWLRKARHSFERSAAEYLTEESRDLATSTEVEEFCNDVDTTAAAVERFEARMALQREASAAQKPE